MDRATSPVVGVALLVALTVMAATAVGTAAVALDTPSPAPTASFSLTVDGERDTLTFRHLSGESVDTDALRLVVSVEGERLVHQPPVPFFAAEGFQSGPTGPLNRGADPSWTAGERATLGLAGTNAPLPEVGDRVTVRIVVDGQSVTMVQTVAG